MIGVGHDFQLDRDSCTAQALRQPHALVTRHPRVRRAVLDEERWSTSVDVTDRAGRPRHLDVLTDRPAEQAGLERVGRRLVEGQEIRHRVPANDAPDGWAVAAQCCQGGEMSASRCAPQVDAGRIDADLGGVVGEPAQRLDGVVVLGREQGLAAEAVVGRGDDESGCGESLEEAVGPPASLPRWATAMALAPPTAVEVDEQWAQATVGIGRPVDVELEGPEPLTLGKHDRLVDPHA